MSDYISKQAMLKHVEKKRQEALMMDDLREASIVMNGMHLLEEAARNQPSVQPERKKGKWIHGKEIAREYLSGRITHIEYKDYHCSECGYTVENIRWNVDGELVDRYCTACGAQMEVEE